MQARHRRGREGGLRLTPRRLSRRRLIAEGGTAAAGLVLGSRLGGAGRAEAATGSVIVVGAGLAGLTAAYELRRAGWAVTVLEARDRVGGRAHTVRDAFGGQHAEGGGEYVDTRHSALRGYLKRFGIGLEDSGAGYGDTKAIVWRGGRRRRAGSLLTKGVERQMNRFYGRIEKLAAPLDPADPAAAGSGLDSRTAAQLLDELRIDGAARFLLEVEIRDDYGVEPGELSLLFVAQSYAAAENQSDAGIEAFRIRGGSDRLPRAFARRLGGAVHLGALVTAVEHSAGGVLVRTAGGAAIAADHCVLAAPLPALRGVSFVPPLPAPLPAAIAQLQYAPITKTLLRFESRFWRRSGLSGDAFTDLSLGSTWEATNAQPGRQGILISYAAGRNARALAPRSNRATARLARRQVDRVFPGSAPPLASHVLPWAKMPLSGGAYSAWAPGQVGAFWTALRGSYGRLRFAGEHTDDLSGYMEGAIRSGRRVAAEIAGA